jgi:hypothetical protein
MTGVTTMGKTFTLPGPVREAPVDAEPLEPDMIEVPADELARLRAVEAAARAYRDEYLRQFAAVEDGTFTWHAEEYNTRNQVRHVLFEALDGA